MIRVITHSKRKFIYEFIDAIGFLFVLFVIVPAIGQKTGSPFIEKYYVIFVMLFFIGLTWIFVRIFIGRMKWYKPVNKIGEIDFYDDYLIIKQTKIRIEQIKTIRIDVTHCKGQFEGGRSGLSDGTGNYIELFLRDKTRFKEAFLIENLRIVNDLKSLMESWKKTGILVVGDWKPMLTILDK